MQKQHSKAGGDKEQHHEYAKVAGARRFLQQLVALRHGSDAISPVMKARAGMHEHTPVTVAHTEKVRVPC